MSDTRSKRFPSVFEVEAPSGAEDWAGMYPGYLVPDPLEETAENLFLFRDSLHYNNIVFPFDSVIAEACFFSASQYSTRVFTLPNSLGLSVKIVNGYLYIATNAVTDPELVNSRAVTFKQRADYYFANWDRLYDQWKEKVQQAIHEMEQLHFPSLPEVEHQVVVDEGRGSSTGYQWSTNYLALIDKLFLIWQYHFEFLNLAYAAYGTFFGLCKELFPEITDQTISNMSTGIEALVFQPEVELRKLAKLAVSQQVTSAFDTDRSYQEMLAELEGSEAGRTWIAALEKVKYPWFNFSTELGFSHEQVSWIDDLTFPFQGIARYIDQLQRGESIDRPVEELQTKRDQLVDEYRELLNDDERARFDGLLGLVRQVLPVVEDHGFYIEHWSHTVFFAKVRELGKALHEADFLAAPGDVFYINRHELSEVVFDVVNAWAVGTPPVTRRRWQEKVADRKQMIDRLRETTPLPALGEPPEVITDPFAIMNYGVTTERVQEWLGAGQDGGLRGIPASSGVVEAPARVVTSEKQLDQVEPGEVLVCTVAAPSWTPIFSRIRAVVTDIGGMMSHPAIVCREYGVPAVVGTGFGTQRIRTGDIIRVDGNTGTITVVHSS